MLICCKNTTKSWIFEKNFSEFINNANFSRFFLLILQSVTRKGVATQRPYQNLKT
jgi:hypothetical protein